MHSFGEEKKKENQDLFCPLWGRKGNWALENQLMLPIT